MRALTFTRPRSAMGWARVGRVPGALVLCAGLATACASERSARDDSTAEPSATASASPAAPSVVASTSWVGALAKAAGAANVTVIAPASVQHPPDYDPKPSDLAAVADADYVLYAEFDGFAQRLKEAAGGNGELVPVELENTPGKIHAEVTRLGERFGTTPAASAWLTIFDAEYTRLSGEIRSALPSPAPTAVAQLFMAYWATDFAGLQLVGTYGPAPMTAGQLSDLTGRSPQVDVANSHLPQGNSGISGTREVALANYPSADLDLLGVFRSNAEKLRVALQGATPGPSAAPSIAPAGVDSNHGTSVHEPASGSPDGGAGSPPTDHGANSSGHESSSADHTGTATTGQD